MYLHFLLLLFSSRASSYFLPLNETLHLQKKAKYAIIDEMLCLLEAEKAPLSMQFFKPLHIKNQSCAHDNTENFIKELQKIDICKCMKIVESDMKKLQNSCPILKSLEEFLKWLNTEQECRLVERSDSGLYQDGKCSCPDTWKYPKGLL